jgi:uncharacterized protein with von Willebrand factor type A (vWA) domain
MSASKKPALSDAEKVGAAMRALADAHDTMAAAYARFLDDEVTAALDTLGIESRHAETFEQAFERMSELSHDAAKALREVQIDRASVIRSTIKAQRSRRDALKAIHVKAKDALTKKSDGKTMAAEKSAAEPLEQAESLLSENERKEPQFVAVVAQASLRDLAHIEATFHAGCLQSSTATMLAMVATPVATPKPDVDAQSDTNSL